MAEPRKLLDRLWFWPVLLALGAHLPALWHPLVWDDLRVVAGNPSIRALGDLRHVLLGSQRPTTNLVYAVEYALGHGQPLWFHLGSILAHAGTTCLLIVLARRLRDRHNVHLSPMWIGAVFAIHPLVVESVDYPAALPGVLCAFFSLAAFLSLRERRGPQVLGLVCFALALGSKESAAALPLVLIVDATVFSPNADRRALWTRHLGLCVLVAVAGAWRLSLHLGRQNGSLPSLSHLGTQAVVLFGYARLLVIPVGFSLYHDIAPSLPLMLGAIAAVLAIVIAVAVRGLAWLRFGLAWFVLYLLPSSLLPLREPMAEHRVYEALPGALIAFAAAIQLFPSRVRLPILAFFVAAFTFTGLSRAALWKSERALWADAAAKAPNAWVPTYSYGDALRLAGDCRAAVPVYDHAISLTDLDTRAHQNRGLCRAELGDLAGARDDFEVALRRDPRDPSLPYNLGLLAEAEGDLPTARTWFAAVLAIQPSHAGAARALARVGKP